LNDYVKLNELDEKRVRDLLCWPNFNEQIYLDRLRQLKELRVEAIALGGPHNVMGHPVLGKGHVGLVLKSLWHGKEVALKIRRTDSDRLGMEEEARLLEVANSVNVGPRLYNWSGDFLVQERLDGEYLRDWVKRNQGDAKRFSDISLTLLYKARRLDEVGLDHGELVKVRRHFIITVDGPRIIDFESASLIRRAHNVVSIAQSMFLNIGFLRLIEDFFDVPDRDEIIDALKRYKKTQTEENFLSIINVCGLNSSMTSY
jgi:putative serine/threonine protein kinase